MRTERLTIDRISPKDREDFFDCISNDKKVLETFVCEYSESLEQFDFAPYLKTEGLFAIRLTESNRLIGIILYFNRDEDGCEIGYALGSKYWNHGYATEAAKAFIAHCFSVLDCKQVLASVFAENDSSKKVLEKCGMRYIHTVEKGMEYLGAERDLVYYMLEAEYAYHAKES